MCEMRGPRSVARVLGLDQRAGRAAAGCLSPSLTRLDRLPAAALGELAGTAPAHPSRCTPPSNHPAHHHGRGLHRPKECQEVAQEGGAQAPARAQEEGPAPAAVQGCAAAAMATGMHAADATWPRCGCHGPCLCSTDTQTPPQRLGALCGTQLDTAALLPVFPACLQLQVLPEPGCSLPTRTLVHPWVRIASPLPCFFCCYFSPAQGCASRSRR